MKSIEEMESELVAAGYKWINNEYDFTHWLLNTPNNYTKFNDTEEAYAYLKQVQFLDELARLRDDFAAYQKKELQARQDGNSLEARKMFDERIGVEKNIVQVVLSWKGDSDE